jgi:hypothetical protein
MDDFIIRDGGIVSLLGLLVREKALIGLGMIDFRVDC